MIQRMLALFLFVALLPLLGILFIIHIFYSKGSFLFIQKRVGKNKKTFCIYKIRTMIPDAEKLKSKYRLSNEVQWPVFKIHDDPRYTPLGKYLSHTGLDELPQLINIIKGEMAFIGPRPLAPDEVKGIPSKYQRRFSVLPGITSPWVIKGTHKLSFDEWMKLDIEYIHHKSVLKDLLIALLTVKTICFFIYNETKRRITFNP